MPLLMPHIVVNKNYIYKCQDNAIFGSYMVQNGPNMDQTVKKWTFIKKLAISTNFFSKCIHKHKVSFIRDAKWCMSSKMTLNLCLCMHLEIIIGRNSQFFHKKAILSPFWPVLDHI